MGVVLVEVSSVKVLYYPPSDIQTSLPLPKKITIKINTWLVPPSPSHHLSLPLKQHQNARPQLCLRWCPLTRSSRSGPHVQQHVRSSSCCSRSGDWRITDRYVCLAVEEVGWWLMVLFGHGGDRGQESTRELFDQESQGR